MSSIWINPQGDTGGNGGGGTPSSVQWSDIRNKPSEFTPKAHTHVIADVKDLQEDLHSLRTLIKNNQENITLVIEGLDDYVVKEEGKELSSNDFTDELKLALEALIDSENGGITGDYVISINGKSGVIDLDKTDIGLENVLNQQQATKIEFDKLTSHMENQFTDVKDSLKTKAEIEYVTSELDNKANTSEVLSLLSQKVDKKEGYQLSQNDFTNEHKEKLESLDSGGNGGGETPSGVYVETVNGKSGKVIINKETLGLDMHYTTKEDFKEFTEQANIEHAEVREIASSKVSKEEGKGLSEENFTSEEKSKLSQIDLQELEHPVTSVNSKTGEVVLNHVDIGLENVKNIEQATKEEFDTHINNTNTHVTLQEKSSWSAKETTQGAQSKATKALEESKAYTDSEIEKIPPFNDSHLATKEELEKHTSNNDIHLNSTDKENLAKVQELEKDLQKKVNKEEGKALSTNDFTNTHKNKLEQFDTLNSTLSAHINNPEVHLSKEQKDLVNTLPELATNVQSLDNEINRILELLGEGGEIPDGGVIEVIKKGHLYVLGNEVFDVIHKNKVTGTLARAFVQDNISLFESNNFMYNVIDINVYGQLTAIFTSDPTPKPFEGVFKDILDLKNMTIKDKVTINGVEAMDVEFQARWIGNRFSLRTSMGDYNGMDTGGEITLKDKASVNLSINVDLTAPEFTPRTRQLGYNITSNTFIFENLHSHTINFNTKLEYKESASEINDFLVYIDLDNNTFTINNRENYTTTNFNYDYSDLEPIQTGVSQLYLGIEPVIQNNKICDELLRRSGNTFIYTPERQQNKVKPILTNATMIHTLSMEMDIRPNVKFGTEELEQAVTANKNSQLNKSNLKNIVIVDNLEELDTMEIYDGLIAIVSKKE